MLSATVAVLLAAAIPADNLSSVAAAAYWYRKDERGRGDNISEEAKPRRFPAFAVGEDTFLVADPFVRAKHLDRIEIWFRGEKVPAREVARIECPEAVVLKASRAVKGISPLAFSRGDPVEKQVWTWRRSAMSVRASDVGTNTMTEVMAATGRVFRRGEANALYLDKDRRPVWLDFGSRMEVTGDRFEYVPPTEWTRLGADTFEKAAAAIETNVVAASLGVLLRLEAEEKDGRQSIRIVYMGGDNESKNEIDAVGYAIGERVIVPCDIGGDKIARLQKAEATFPDGTSTNLVFVGALAEWNAILFDVPDGCKPKLRRCRLPAGRGLRPACDRRHRILCARRLWQDCVVQPCAARQGRAMVSSGPRVRGDGRPRALCRRRGGEPRVHAAPRGGSKPPRVAWRRDGAAHRRSCPRTQGAELP